jgi:E3 Ubiquitin ligase
MPVGRRFNLWCQSVFIDVTEDRALYAVILLTGGGLFAIRFGLFTLLKGLGDVYDRRRAQNTPRSKCRSIALGAVELSGTAAGPNPIPSLVAQIPAFISQVLVEEYEDTRKSRGWRKLHEQEFRIPFFLEDETGRVKVNPEGANCSLMVDAKYSTSWRDGSEEYSRSALDRALQLPGPKILAQLFDILAGSK